jgi:hypothetical protein
MDQVAGHISYLNREKDARQFAQPIVKQVKVNVMPRYVQQKVKRGIIKQYNYIVDNIKKDIHEKEKEVKTVKKDDETVKNIENHFLKRVCDSSYTGKSRTACKKKIRNLAKTIKENNKEKLNLIKETTKVDKDQLNYMKKQKIDAVKNALQEVDNTATPYLTNSRAGKMVIPNGVLHQLAYKCTKKDYSSDGFVKYLKEHSPDIVIAEEAFDGLIRDIKNTKRIYSKEKDKTIKKRLKDELEEMEERYKIMKKNRGTIMNKAKIALKRQTKKTNSNFKKTQRETKKAIKELHKREEYENAIEEIDETFEKFVHTVGDMQQELDEKEKEEKQKKENKEKEKLEKMQEKLRVRQEKERVREEKAIQKIREREEKKREKERAKTEKAMAKLAASSNKTRKNKKEK